MTTFAQTLPWYRHRWPWFLMIAPAVAVLAGVATLALALRSEDGLVADDYYKRGLAINQALERSRAAPEREVQATVAVTADGANTAEIALRGAPPATLRVRLAHPTRAGLDRSATLVRGADGLYRGSTVPPTDGRWRIGVEAEGWKLAPVEVAGLPLRAVLRAGH
jgi:hypothetical protein